MPAEERGLSMVFQSYAIWPHMTVFENVAYGLRVRRQAAAEIREKVQAALDLVQMGAFADRPASQLSGGQQQRVALARACAFSPERAAVRRAAVQPRRQAARRHADRAARAAAPARRHLALRDARPRGGAGDVRPDRGHARRADRADRRTPGEIYNYPRTEFVADFVGSANLIAGRLRPDLAGDGLVALETEGGTVVHGVDARPHARARTRRLSVRTVHLHLTPERPPGERNVWPVTVGRTVFLGDLTQAHVAWGGRELVVRHTRLPVAGGPASLPLRRPAPLRAAGDR